jgi:hypothetical protein
VGGLTDSTIGSLIQTDVELKLRLAGIQVLTQAESQSAPGRPWLCLIATIQRSGQAPTYHYNIGLELQQDVILVRNPSVTTRGPTWSTGGLGGSSDIQVLRDVIKDNVDIFINAYLSVNPKK